MLPSRWWISFSPDHPAGRGILSHSRAHPSSRPLLWIPTPPLSWQVIQNKSESFACSLSAAGAPPLNCGRSLGPSLQPAGGRGVCFCVEMRREQGGKSVWGLQQIRRRQDSGAPPQDAGGKTKTPTVELESSDSQIQHKTPGSDIKTDKGAFNETTVWATTLP